MLTLRHRVKLTHNPYTQLEDITSFRVSDRGLLHVPKFEHEMHVNNVWKNNCLKI